MRGDAVDARDACRFFEKSDVKNLLAFGAWWVDGLYRENFNVSRTVEDACPYKNVFISWVG